jgi:hypothetical protein
MSNSAPTLGTLSVNKTTLIKGVDTLVLTVPYADLDNQVVTITVQAADAAGNQSPAKSIDVTITDPTAITATDNGPHWSWTNVSDDGTKRVLSTLA